MTVLSKIPAPILHRVLLAVTAFIVAFAGQLVTLSGAVDVKALIAAVAAGATALVHYALSQAPTPGALGADASKVEAAAVTKAESAGVPAAVVVAVKAPVDAAVAEVPAEVSTVEQALEKAVEAPKPAA